MRSAHAFIVRALLVLGVVALVVVEAHPRGDNKSIVGATSSQSSEEAGSAASIKHSPSDYGDGSSVRDEIQRILDQICEWQDEHLRSHHQGGLHSHRNGHQSEAKIGGSITAGPEQDGFDPHKPTPRRPFVTLTFAQSLDGKIALRLPHAPSDVSTNLPISGPESLMLTHGLRSIHDAILVGGRTLAVDNPRLSNRLWKSISGDTSTVHANTDADVDADQVADKDGAYSSEWSGCRSEQYNSRCSEGQVVRSPQKEAKKDTFRQPIPVVLDTHLSYLRQLDFQPRASFQETAITPSQASLTDLGMELARMPRQMIVCCSAMALSGLSDNEKHAAMQSQIIFLPCAVALSSQSADLNTAPSEMARTRPPSLDPADVLQRLHQVHNIRSVMVEGGASILTAFAGASNRMDQRDSDGCIPSRNLVDCLCVTIAPTILGHQDGIPAFKTDGLVWFAVDEKSGNAERGQDTAPGANPNGIDEGCSEKHFVAVTNADDGNKAEDIPLTSPSRRGRSGALPSTPVPQFSLQSLTDPSFVQLGNDCILLGRWSLQREREREREASLTAE